LFITFLETGTPPGGLFAPGVFVDFTMPQWRLQARGSDDAVRLRRAGHPAPGRVPRAGGVAVAASTQLREAAGQAWWTGQPRTAADVFVLGLTEAVLIEWDLEHGRMTSTRWSSGHGLRRQSRSYP
jgi:hypothetical protein